MKKILLLASSAVLMLFNTSCSDYFLNLEPTDTETEANYYKTAAEFQAAANSTYSFYAYKDVSETVNGTKYTHTIYNTWDANTDMGGGFSDAQTGNLAAGTTDTYWSLCYAKIRKCNVVIEKGDEYTGTDDISEYIAVARFFRAYQYFWLVQRFGGVPIVAEVLSSDSKELYGARNSRYEVIDFILDDLDYAISNLPDESGYDGHVTKQGAQAFKARVLLFESTWEKYVGTTTDGDGVSDGAGSTKPSDYPSVSSMLTDAANLADSVMSSGKYSLWNASSTVYKDIAYYYLFNLEDENTNPMGYTKDNNREFILQVCYDHTSQQIAKNITHTYGSAGVSLKWMNTVPCVSDGLPYLYSTDYAGYNKMANIYTNRDSRLASVSRVPGNTYYEMGTNGADASTYKEADYVTCFDFPSGCSVYYPVMTSTGGTGYVIRKATSERKDYSDTEESYNFPVMRLAEIYLIYAEAKCELGGGTISDDDLNKSINLLHERAGSADISNASVAQANANYAVNTGKTGSLTMLELIRNERAVELISENQRGYDLMRWGIAEDNNENRLGIVAKNPDGSNTEIVNFSYTAGGVTQVCWSDAIAIYGYETIDDGSQALIVTPASQANMQRYNYLTPLPLSELQLNSNLLQNPGY